MKITKGQSLMQIEKKFKDKIQDVEVVSEIELEEKQYEKLIDLVKTHTSNVEQEDIVNHLWANYPNVSLVITVFVAIYEYDQNLWGNFTRVTGIEDESLWKDYLWSYLKSKGVRVFHEKENRKYFHTVLGHAGIPYHSVPTLLENVIIPANERGLNEINIYENVKSEKYGSVVHKGVQSFIGLGDRVSFSMIHRIQNVWRSSNKPFLKNYAEYLPNHILQAMDEFKPKHPESPLDYKRPFIQYDLEQRTINLNIPSVRIHKMQPNDMYWLIKDTTNKVTKRIEMEGLVYGMGDFEEFTPEEFTFSLEPKHTYKIELSFENRSKPIYEEKFNVKTPLVQFNKERTLVSLQDAYLDREYDTVTIIVDKKQANLVKRGIKNANFYETNLTDLWKNYTAILIKANGKDIIQLNKYVINLNNKSFEPYLGGDKQDHLINTEYPLFKEVPYVVLPSSMVAEINNGHITLLEISKQNTNQAITMKINNANLSFQNNGVILDIEKIMKSLIHQNEKIEFFTVSLSGKLGYDYHLSFILIKDFDVKLKQGPTQKLKFQVPKEYSFSIQWPMNVDFEQKGNNYYIDVPEHQYKIKLLVFHEQSNVSLDLILYTALYDINFIGSEMKYPIRSEINKELWNNNNLEMVIDTTNPSFEKMMGNQTKMEIVGEKQPIELDIFSDQIYYFPTESIFERKVKKNITYLYRFSNDTEHNPLITIKNMWVLKDVEYSLSGLELSLKWTQSNYFNERFIRIWKLNRPEEMCIDIPITNRTRSLHFQFDEAGILYMVEWKDECSKNDNRPIFAEGKYKIFKIDTSKSLAYLLLLHDDDVKEERFTLEKIVDLLKVIDYFGDKYLSHITEDFDACCDFGLRVGAELIEIYSEKNIKTNFVNILTQIAGAQELDKNTLFAINGRILNRRIDYNFNKLSAWYFSQELLIQEIKDLSLKQLNLRMQLIKSDFLLINEFSWPKELVKFIFKVKSDSEFSNYVHHLLSTYGEAVNNLFKELKLKHHQKISSSLFNQIYRRNYERYSDSEYLKYPYFIAQLALLNRAFLEVGDTFFGDEGRKNVRIITQKVLENDRYWFMHDLVYLSLYLNKKPQKRNAKIG